MRDWYDSPQLSDVFIEQAERLPNGTLGYLTPHELEVIEDLPNEAVSLLRNYMKGEISTLEFINRIEKVRLSSVVIETQEFR